MLKRDDDFEEEEGGDDWLASYSDLITDLLAVFVLLLSFALLNRGNANMTSSVENIALTGGSGLLIAEGMINDSKDKHEDSSEIDELIKDLEGRIAEENLQELIQIDKQTDSRLVIRIGDSILFDTAKATLKDEVAPMLESVAGILSEYADDIKSINVEGHTDNQPISNPIYPSNWELSTGRAGSVVRYLIEKSDINAVKFSSSGYGEYQPIAENTTPEGRAQNRRVEVSIELHNAAS